MKMMLKMMIGVTDATAKAWTSAETLAIVTISARMIAKTKSSSRPTAVFMLTLSGSVSPGNLVSSLSVSPTLAD